MSDNTQMAGKVVSLWRYPIKSMLGEELNATAVTSGLGSGGRHQSSNIARTTAIFPTSVAPKYIIVASIYMGRETYVPSIRRTKRDSRRTD